MDYEKHQTIHAKNRPYACNYCDKKFAFKQGLERHEIIHNMQSMTHGCEYCSDRFKTPARLQRHLSSAHAGTRAFPCSKCSKRFMLSHHLYRHMRTSHRSEDDDITIQCPDCDSVFNQRELFFDHCLEHVNVTNICPMCKYENEDLEEINAHVLLHSKSDMYFCDYCSCIFMTQEVLNDHFIEKHSNELCAIGEDEVELIVENAIVAKREIERSDDFETTTSVCKKFKPQNVEVEYVEETPVVTGASFVEYDEEIEEELPIKLEKSIPLAITNKLKKEDIKKVLPKKMTTTTATIQRVKMSQSEIKRLQKEGKIIVKDGVLVMKN